MTNSPLPLNLHHVDTVNPPSTSVLRGPQKTEKVEKRQIREEGNENKSGKAEFSRPNEMLCVLFLRSWKTFDIFEKKVRERGKSENNMLLSHKSVARETFSFVNFAPVVFPKE